MAARIRGTNSQRLRLAASGPVLRNYFPSILAAHRQKYPALRLSLRETNQLEAETFLQTNEVDLAITECEGKSPPGIKSRIIVELPPAFMVPKASRWKKAEQLLDADCAREPLIALPASEALTRLFQKGFDLRGERFVVGVEVSSLDSMKTYVVGGFGVGLAVASPEASEDHGIRLLPIATFPKLVLGALWIGKLPEIAQSFLDRVERSAAELR